ncbi:MAG: S1 RNA-binding domain-containing protein [Fimbriimonadaceae bacterium]
MQIDETLSPTSDQETAIERPISDLEEGTETQPGLPEEAVSPDAPVPGDLPMTEETPANEAQPEPMPAVVEEPQVFEPVAAEVAVDVTAAEEAPMAPEDELALFEAAFHALGSDDQADSSARIFMRGARVEAEVVQVEKDRVFVDLGMKQEGVVPIDELSVERLESAGDHVKVGDRIAVVVTGKRNEDGAQIVSKKRADFEEVWDRIEEHKNNDETVQAQVIDRVKGGLVVDLGVRGFVPATHVGSGKLRNIEKYVGQSIPLKILEIDRERKKVVLSNKLAEDERKAEAKENLFNTVRPGMELEGTVRRLTDYGAFVDIGGVDGLLHISEMSWMRITHPREMFKEGQKIKVMVLRLDPNTSKISLGHRQVMPDPWNLIRENYRINQKLTCKVGRMVQGGVFVRLPEGAEAFLPVSEISNRRIRKPDDLLEENQEIEVQIIDLRPEERRMVLSIRALGGDVSRPSGAPSTYEGGDDRGGDKRGGKKKGKKGGRRDDEEFDDFGSSRRITGGSGGATIGERLGALRGFFRSGEEIDDDIVDDAEEVEITEEVVDSTPESATEAVAESAAAPETEKED